MSQLKSLFHCNINVTSLDVSLPFYEMIGFKVIIDFREGMISLNTGQKMYE